MSRLGDLARRVLAGALVRECGLVGPRAPEPPESVPEPVRASMLAWADGAVPVAIGLDPAGGLVQWMPPRVHRPGARPPIIIVDEVAGLYDDDVRATLRGKSDAMRRLRRMYGIEHVESAHRLHLAKVNMAIRLLGGRTNDNCGRRALPPSTLPHCLICDRLLDDPADPVGSYDCGGDCRRCMADVGDEAARAVLGLPSLIDDEDAEHEAAIEGWRR